MALEDPLWKICLVVSTYPSEKYESVGMITMIIPN